METIFPIITKKVMFSYNNRNCIRNKVKKKIFFFLTFHLTLYIYTHTHTKFSYTITFENLMNDATSHLMSLLWKSSVSKYMIMVRSITNEIIKKMIKLISNYYYRVLVHCFTHLKKLNI